MVYVVHLLFAFRKTRCRGRAYQELRNWPVRSRVVSNSERSSQRTSIWWRMIKKLSNDEVRRLRDLQRGGILLDEEVLEGLKRASRGLSLFQSGNAAENEVFDLDDGGWGCTLSVAIHNDADRVIRLRHYRLQVPWHEPDFRWLENPLRKSPREPWYSFPPHGPIGFEPEDVLNHRVGSKGQLNPGESFEGLLLGAGRGCLPDEFGDHQHVPSRLTVFGGRDDRCELEVTFWVHRRRRIGYGKRCPDRLSSKSINI
jgi:hypothetical protein